MNLYAAVAEYAPTESDTHLFLAEDDKAAMEQGVFIAAKDACGEYFSTTADVYVVARNVEKIGTAQASDASWAWAHPGVEQALAMNQEV